VDCPRRRTGAEEYAARSSPSTRRRTRRSAREGLGTSRSRRYRGRREWRQGRASRGTSRSSKESPQRGQGDEARATSHQHHAYTVVRVGTREVAVYEGDRVRQPTEPVDESPGLILDAQLEQARDPHRQDEVEADRPEGDWYAFIRRGHGYDGRDQSRGDETVEHCGDDMDHQEDHR